MWEFSDKCLCKVSLIFLLNSGTGSCFCPHHRRISQKHVSALDNAWSPIFWLGVEMSSIYLFILYIQSSIQSYRQGITIASLCFRKLKGFRDFKEKENWERKSTKSSSQYRQGWNRTLVLLHKLCTSYYCIMSGSPPLRQELSHTWSVIWHWQRREWFLAA